MSILDDAIREHLELKRAHGADEAELKRLEDEAFGPAERPDQADERFDPYAEAPTEFLTTPGEDPGASPAEGRRPPNVADLQEPPPPAEREGGADAERPAGERPSVEEHPAMEHRAVARPAPGDQPAPPTDELQPDPEAPGATAASGEAAAGGTEITEQPTQLFDVERHLEEDAGAGRGSEEQVRDAEQARSDERAEASPLSAAEPAAEEQTAAREEADEEEPVDEFDEFFSEQRLSDELNQALEAPLPDEPGAPATKEAFSPFLDPETELGAAPEEAPRDEPEDRREADAAGETGEEADLAVDPGEEADAADEPRAEADAAEYTSQEPGHVDALEDTPDFLEESPEDDDAWFEQRHPKDFDFGD